jgi:hypothetical protein
MGYKLMERVLKFFLWKSCYIIIKTNLKGHNSMPLYSGMNNFDLELSKWQLQLVESKIALPKPTPMNHHH